MTSGHTSAAAERKDHPRSGLPPIDPPDGTGEDAQIRVLIADDHAMFRAGLRKLLEAEVGFEVVGEAENGVSATALTRKLAPHVLLLDFAMPGMSGVEVLRELATDTGRTRTVVLTASIAPHEMTDVLQHGAAGVLMKTAATELLYECVRSVAQGQYLGGARHGGLRRRGPGGVASRREAVGAAVRADAARDRRRATGGRGLFEPRDRDAAPDFGRHREAPLEPNLRQDRHLVAGGAGALRAPSRRAGMTLIVPASRPFSHFSFGRSETDRRR